MGCYVLLGLLSLQTAFLQSNDATFWMPSGFGLAVLVAYGGKAWPVVACGSFATNLAVNLTSGAARPGSVFILVALVVSLGNTLEALVARRLLRQEGPKLDLNTSPRVLRFAAIAASFAPIASALCGVGISRATGFSQEGDVLEDFANWYIANSVGILIFTLPFSALLNAKFARPTVDRPVEAACLLACILIAGQAITGPYLAQQSADWPRVYLLFPLLIWATYRFKLTGCVCALVLISLMSGIGSVRGFRAFKSQTIMHTLLSLQIFLGLLGVTMFLLAAALMHNAEMQRTLSLKLSNLKNVHADTTNELLLLRSLVVHDLRSPLLAMRLALVGAASSLRSDAAKIASSLEIMEESASICTALAQQIGSAFDAKVSPSPQQPRAMSEIVARVLSTIGFSKPPGVEFDQARCDNIMITRPQEVERIVCGVLLNAFKHAKSQVTFEVDAGEQLNIWVCDDGPAAERNSEEQDNKIVEEPGLGIGLRLAQAQAGFLGGSIKLLRQTSKSRCLIAFGEDLYYRI